MTTYTKGYKAFNKTNNQKQGECRDFIFDEGSTYEIEGGLKLCENGFHFCKDLVLTFEYYGSDTKEFCFAEVEAVGDIVYEEPSRHKAATSALKILRFLSEEEFLSSVDSNGNSGDGNSGDGNSGDGNSGDGNSGNWNSGYGNSGDRNSGNWNSGYWNSGDRNSGNWNSGDWNSCNRESGFFNSTKPEFIRVFNKPCLLSEWESTEKPNFLFFGLIGGKTYKESFQESFLSATQEDVDMLKRLPNFDADVFFDISGIRL